MMPVRQQSIVIRAGSKLNSAQVVPVKKTETKTNAAPAVSRTAQARFSQDDGDAAQSVQFRDASASAGFRRRSLPLCAQGKRTGSSIWPPASA
jgi:hypothetical protein